SYLFIYHNMHPYIYTPSLHDALPISTSTTPSLSISPSNQSSDGDTLTRPTATLASFTAGTARALGLNKLSPGYPGDNLFNPNALAVPAVNDARVAVGLVRVSPSELWFEGDIDNDGVVDVEIGRASCREGV